MSRFTPPQQPIGPAGFSKGTASQTLILGELAQFKQDTSMCTDMLCICSFSSSTLPETQHQTVSADEWKNGSSQVENLEENQVSN